MADTTLPGTRAGALFAVLAALSFALWNIYLQRGLEKGGGPRLSMLTLSLSVTAAFLPLALWLGGRGALPPVTAAGAAWFLVAGLLTAAAGPLCAAHATRRIGATRTTALRLLDPFFAYLLAFLFLGERLGGRAVGGIVLIVAALLLLRLDGRRSAAGSGGGVAAGVAFAVAASLFFTLGSVARKAGLGSVPSAVVAGAGEGVAGLLAVLPAIAAGRAWGELRAAFRPEALDLWWSGLSAAAGTLFLNLALQRAPVPVAVALRNTSPWFALVLVPLLIGREHRPGPWIWASTALLTAGMLLIVTG